MDKLVLDLRGVEQVGEETWADCPARAQMEKAILDHWGEIVAVRITCKRQRKESEA